MGSLISLTPLLGLLSGVIIAYLTKYELKDGEKYFILLQHFLLSVLLVVLLWETKVLATSLALILFAVLSLTGFSHKFFFIPFLSIPASLNQASLIPIFLYLIPTGSRNWNEKKELCYMSILFTLVVVLSIL